MNPAIRRNRTVEYSDDDNYLDGNDSSTVESSELNDVEKAKDRHTRHNNNARTKRSSIGNKKKANTTTTWSGPKFVTTSNLDDLFDHIDISISKKRPSGGGSSVHSSSLRTEPTVPLTPSTMSTMHNSFSSIGTFDNYSLSTNATMVSMSQRSRDDESIGMKTPSSSASAWKLRESMKNLDSQGSLTSMNSMHSTMPVLPEALRLASLSYSPGSITLSASGSLPSSTTGQRAKRGRRPRPLKSLSVSALSTKRDDEEDNSKGSDEQEKALKQNNRRKLASTKPLKPSMGGSKQPNKSRRDGGASKSDTTTKSSTTTATSKKKRGLRRRGLSSDDSWASHKQRSLSCLDIDNDDDDHAFVDEDSSHNQEESRNQVFSDHGSIDEEAEELLEEEDDNDTRMAAWQLRERRNSLSSLWGVNLISTPNVKRRSVTESMDLDADMADEILQTPSTRWRSQIQFEQLPSAFANLAMSSATKTSSSSFDGSERGESSSVGTRSRSNTPTHLIRKSLSNTIKKIVPSGGGSNMAGDKAAKVDALKDRIRTRWTEMNEERANSGSISISSGRSSLSAYGSVECDANRRLQQHRQSQSLRETRSIDITIPEEVVRPKNIRRTKSLDLNQLELGSVYNQKAQSKEKPKESQGVPKFRGKKKDFQKRQTGDVRAVQGREDPPMVANEDDRSDASQPQQTQKRKAPRPRSLKHPRRLEQWQIEQEQTRHRVAPSTNALYSRSRLEDSDEEERRMKDPSRRLVPPPFSRSHSVGDLSPTTGDAAAGSGILRSRPKIDMDMEDRQRIRDEIAEHRKAFVASRKSLDRRYQSARTLSWTESTDPTEGRYSGISAAADRQNIRDEIAEYRRKYMESKKRNTSRRHLS